MSDAKAAVVAAVDAIAADLVELSHWVHAHPEIAFQEHESSRHIAAFLAARGFAVEQPFAGLDTAFRSEEHTSELQSH